MCDSLRAFHPIDLTLSEDEYKRYGFPVYASVSGRLDQLYNADGSCPIRRTPTWFDVHGLTGTFKVRGRLLDTNSWRLAGYESSINVPACTVGQNVLLENSVAAGLHLATLLLQRWLVVAALHPQAAYCIDVETAQLIDVTPTNLYSQGSQVGAQESRAAFEIVTELLNKSRGAA